MHRPRYRARSQAPDGACAANYYQLIEHLVIVQSVDRTFFLLHMEHIFLCSSAACPQDILTPHTHSWREQH